MKNNPNHKEASVLLNSGALPCATQRGEGGGAALFAPLGRRAFREFSQKSHAPV